MKDEIKEILKDLEFCSGIFDYTITPDRCTFLKDYITNLQEELYSTNQVVNELLDVKKENEKLKKKLDRKYYKRINEQAIEELDKYINSCEIEAEHTLNNEKCLISVNHSKKVRSILQGVDNNGRKSKNIN